MISSHGLPQFLRVPQVTDLAARDTLQNLRDGHFVALLVFTGLVGLGVLIEGPELFHDIKELITRKSRDYRNLLVPSLYRKEPRPHPLLKIVATIGWLLIVVGVTGEGFEEAMIFQEDRAIQTFNDTFLASLNDKANGALLEQEKLKAANLELQKLIQERDINSDQQKAIGDALKLFAGRFVIIQVYAYDQEALRLATLIKAALNSGRIDAEVFPNPFPGFVNFPVGVQVSGSDKTFVERLRNVLSETGKLTLTDPKWKPQATSGPRTGIWSQKASQADIFVGVKPLPSGQIDLATHPKEGEELLPFSQTIQLYKAK
ncbi:MAG: hypothetical protein WB919_13890 [Candidatus Sulfotelmatobacter sp.]